MDASQFLYVAEYVAPHPPSPSTHHRNRKPPPPLTTTPSRIFPTHIRSQGSAFSMMGLYLADIIILVAGPIALNSISWKFFFVLIVPTFFHILFVYFFCPVRSHPFSHLCWVMLMLWMTGDERPQSGGHQRAVWLASRDPLFWGDGGGEEGVGAGGAEG